ATARGDRAQEVLAIGRLGIAGEKRLHDPHRAQLVEAIPVALGPVPRQILERERAHERAPPAVLDAEWAVDQPLAVAVRILVGPGQDTDPLQGLHDEPADR